MPVTPGQFLQRSGAAAGEFLKPGASAQDRLDQHRVTSRAVLLLRESGQHQLCFDTAPPEGEPCCQLVRREKPTKA
jgi:hypothetical protein